MFRFTRELKTHLPIRGYHPLWPAFPDSFSFLKYDHWPGPLSLVTTRGVSVDVLSSGYLDISVHRVCFLFRFTYWSGFPIRKSADQRLFAPTHSLSQRITSFIASQRQGIHQMPLRRLIAPYTKAESNLLIYGTQAIHMNAVKLHMQMFLRSNSLTLSNSCHIMANSFQYIL